MSQSHFRLGCDIGGTFTDFVLLNDQTGEIQIHKCLTTPDDPSDAVEIGIRAIGHSAVGVNGYRAMGTLGDAFDGEIVIIGIAVIVQDGDSDGYVLVSDGVVISRYRWVVGSIHGDRHGAFIG